MKADSDEDDQHPSPFLRNVVANNLNIGDYVILTQNPC